MKKIFKKLLEDPIPMRILSLLAIHPSMDVYTLQEILVVSERNLGGYLNALEALTYIESKNAFINTIPSYATSIKGRAAFNYYLDRIELLLNDHKQTK